MALQVAKALLRGGGEAPTLQARNVRVVAFQEESAELLAIDVGEWLSEATDQLVIDMQFVAGGVASGQSEPESPPGAGSGGFACFIVYTE